MLINVINICCCFYWFYKPVTTPKKKINIEKNGYNTNNKLNMTTDKTIHTVQNNSFYDEINVNNNVSHEKSDIYDKINVNNNVSQKSDIYEKIDVNNNVSHEKNYIYEKIDVNNLTKEEFEDIRPAFTNVKFKKDDNTCLLCKNIIKKNIYRIFDCACCDKCFRKCESKIL